MNEQLILIPILPLFGALLAFCLGLVGLRNISGWIATLACALAFARVASFFSMLAPAEFFEQRVFNWFSAGNWNFDFTLRFDALTAVMCLVVTGIGTLIHLYSVAYMHEDESAHRFFAYLNLFMFSMLLLVMGGNMLVMFVGWEGVGLCSYLLIGFWFTKAAYAKAGMKAFVVNRIGDAGFLIGMFLILSWFGTLDFVELSKEVSVSAAAPFVLITLCLFVGATGKSAQIPLFTWLPDAMAGPTPVSALIHAATMVTAGVYMLARMHFMFSLAPLTLAVVCVVALVTAFVAGTTAIAQNDIKKVLAYSTVSQLGFMFLAASAGAYWVALFHVVTHAFFKACLFLGAGSVIHGCHHEQDMRHMGGLWKLMPITAITYGLSVLAIAGIFPLAGYQSKHAILAALQHMHNPYIHSFAQVAYIGASVTALITAFYMTRSFAMTFMGSYRGHAHPHESPWQMVVPLIILAALACVGGIYLEHGLPHYLQHVLSIDLGSLHEGGTSILEGLLGSWIGFVGVFAALIIYGGFVKPLAMLPKIASQKLRPAYVLFQGKYFFDELYDFIIIKPLAVISRILWKEVDQGVVDGAVNGSATLVSFSSDCLSLLQTGQVRMYALFMFIAGLAVIFLYL